MEEMDKLYESLKGGRYFRLLTLLPGPTDKPVECQIAKHPLDNCPPYEALSYCWGDPSQVSPIQCNGLALSVTTNLVSAMRQMRGRDTARLLWIDAVCINQRDVREREGQVLLMGNIYRQAERVLVWLGPAAENSDLVFPLFRRLVPQNGEGVYDTSSNDFSSVENSPPNLSEVVAVSALLSRPWWRRIWVVQEFCLPKSVTVMCGDDSLDWIVLMAGIRILTSKQSSLLQHPGMWAIFSLKALREKIQSSAHVSKDILNLLIEFRCFHATDQRDKVYGLLGLLIPDVDTPSYADNAATLITPDYVATTEECYRQVALAVLSRSSSLDALLSAASATRTIKRKHLLSTLPSWVPDWSDWLDILDASPNIADLTKGFEKEGPWAAKATFDASRSVGLVLSPPKAPEGPILVLSGAAAVDTISRTAGVLNVDMGKTDAQMTRNGGVTRFIRTIWYALGRMGRLSHTFLDWEDMALAWRSGCTAYPTFVARLAAFFATITNGGAAELNVGKEYTYIPLWTAGCLWSLGRLGIKRAAPGLYYGLMGLLTTLDVGFNEHKYDDLLAIGEVACGRRLAITEKGYLALVPADSRPGDSIALLKGACVPYVVRRKGPRFWELVGDSYVHGIMQGEAWRDGDCVDMEFV